MTGANPSREAASRASAAVRARQQQQQAVSVTEEQQRKMATFHQELTETCVDILAR